MRELIIPYQDEDGTFRETRLAVSEEVLEYIEFLREELVEAVDGIDYYREFYLQHFINNLSGN